MFKMLICAAALAAAFSVQASAMEMMKCNEASMMKVQAGIDKAMKNSSMKKQEDMAMKHMDMAKTAMAAKKNKECAMHLDEAMKALKM